jgi:HSP20 family protein
MTEKIMASNDIRERGKGEVAAAIGGELAPTSLFGDFDRIFDNMMRGFFLSPFERRIFDIPALRRESLAGGLPAAMPKADFSETEKAYELTCELPGLDEKDVDVSLAEGVLTVKGQKEIKREEKDEKRNYYFSERSYGAFHRSFRLPENVDESKISAQFDKGVLTITLPKAAEAVAKQKRSRSASAKTTAFTVG